MKYILVDASLKNEWLVAISEWAAFHSYFGRSHGLHPSTHSIRAITTVLKLEGPWRQSHVSARDPVQPLRNVKKDIDASLRLANR